MPQDMQLSEAIAEAEVGAYSMQVTSTQVEALDAPAAAKALQEQGSDPGFFQLDEAGNDLPEYEL
jgi:hypothetical protein